MKPIFRTTQDAVAQGLVAQARIRQPAVNTHSPQLSVRGQSLRVAIISDAASGRNGVGTFYIDLLQHLKPSVNRIELICPTIQHGKWHAGLVLPLPGDHTQKLCMPNPFTLQRQLKALNPNIIIIATPGAYGLLGAFLADRMRIPVICGFHTSFEQLTKLYWNKSTVGRVVHRYFKVSNRYLFKKSQLILANSDDMMRQALAVGAKNLELINTIISPIFTQPAAQPYSGQLKKILFAGRLAPEKNIDAILQAARQFPQIQFSLAGDGPLSAQVNAAAQDLTNLHCLGWLEREPLRQAIDQHDAVILPSHFESFGTIALEAMARQRFVILTPTCGITQWPEFLPGLYVIRNNLAESLSAINQLDPAQRRCKALIAEKITQELNAKSLKQWLGVLERYGLTAN